MGRKCGELRLLDYSEIHSIMRFVIMYLGWIGAIVCIAGYVLFLNGWNPVVSVAMMFVGSIVAYDMSRRAIKIISTNQDEE